MLWINKPLYIQANTLRTKIWHIADINFDEHQRKRVDLMSKYIFSQSHNT
jgi:hypothetical protein